MNEIRFSHKYPKLPNEDKATLVYVGDLRAEEQTEAFIEYDTKIKDNEYYKLRKQNYLLLLFKTPKGAYFTTIRSKIGQYNRDKENYYKSNLYSDFKIVIGE
jgi:hypothetical protein